jgi:uncharacterized membrane protein YphA (DoxX/SURF4 family)
MLGVRPITIAGWILTLLLTALLLFSASGKFRDFPGKAEMFSKLAFEEPTMRGIGTVEAIITVLYVIPQTAFLGTILLTGYMGGAICAHVRIGDAIIPQVVIGVLIWIGYALRRPDVIAMAFRSRLPPAPGV